MVLRLILLRYADSQQTLDPTELWRSMSIGAKLGVLLAFVAVAWLPAGLAYASVSQRALQAELSVDEVIRSVLRRIALLAVLTVILGLAITVGNFVFFVPGLLIEAFCAFAIPAMVMEKLGIFAAIGRSFSLASRRFWTVLGVLIGAIVVVVLAYLVSAAFLIPLIEPVSGPINSTAFVLFMVLLLLTVPPLAMEIFGSIFAVLYLKLTGDKQGMIKAAAIT